MKNKLRFNQCLSLLLTLLCALYAYADEQEEANEDEVYIESEYAADEPKEAQQENVSDLEYDPEYDE